MKNETLSNKFYCFRSANGVTKWYKFDDGDVSECKMEDDEEMKSQCFGGDYMGEVCIVRNCPNYDILYYELYIK